MFRSMSTHGHFSKEDTRSARDSDESHDSSWISVFSLVSRPAWSLLQRYIPGRAQASFDMKSNLDVANSLMGGLNDPPLQVAYLHCQHEHAARASEGDPATLTWLTRDSLSELGIQTDMQSQASVGYLKTARNLLSQVLMNSTQEKRQPGREVASSWWWDGFGGSEDRPQNLLLNLPQGRKETGTSRQHCGQHHSVAYCQRHSQAAIAMTTELCVCRDDGESMHNESAGPLCSKESPSHMPKPESLTNVYQLPLNDDWKDVLQPQVCSRAFSEVAILTPDQDNGYSSLAEEHSNSKLCSMRLLSEEQEVSGTDGPGGSSSQSNATGNEAHSEPKNCQEEEEKQKDSESDIEKTAEATSAQPPAAENLPVLPTPHCQNKGIAYIMGSPGSEESESEDDSDWDTDDDDDDDDGFDSEGSSHLSESEDLDDSDDESEDTDGEEEDSEAERLWNSLCQTEDPYNPRNFTAPIRTASKPNATTESPVSESPPAHMSSHTSLSPSSPSLSENESSEEACEVDEEENKKLWNSFSCSDPYSLLNFQAPIQTKKPPKSCRKKTSPGTPCYKREEAEERLDSGFSEISSGPCSSSVVGVQQKKVQFVEEIEEFYASSDEDRHGPWEEIARDRCRFQRRVQEVEETISYCLSPTFRMVVFQRLFNTR